MISTLQKRLARQRRAGADAFPRAMVRYSQRLQKIIPFRAIAIMCAGVAFAISALSVAHSIPKQRIVYHYACPPLGKKESTHLRSYKGVKVAIATRWIYKKPFGIPGSRNYVVDVGGEGFDDKGISDLSIMDARGRTLFITHDHMTWSMRSSAEKDTYYIILEAAPLQSSISARGPGWEKIREDAPADGFTYPYMIVETVGRSVRRYQCTFDKRAFVSPAQKKVLASWAGPIRPYAAMQMVSLWLSEHGARMKADRCRRLR